MLEVFQLERCHQQMQQPPLHKLSSRHRVPTRHRALLVVPTERLGLDRQSMPLHRAQVQLLDSTTQKVQTKHARALLAQSQRLLRAMR